MKNVHFYNKFTEQAAAGTLPAFSWIEPRYFDLLAWKANDQHPSHPVPYGEQLIKDVYESLRKGPKWSKTALVITYDEHGGFYDHVVPPLYAPDPEAAACTADGGGPKGFRYNRMGLRVPFIVVSPYTPAKLFNTLEPSQKPTSTSVLEHTSVWQTLKKLYGVSGDLSVRSKWAADFANWFPLTTARTDHPMTLPAVPTPKANPNNQQNGLQHDFTILLSLLIGVPPPTGMVETKAGEFVVSAIAKCKSILEKLEQAKEAVKKAAVATGTAVVNTGKAVVNTGVKVAQATVNGLKATYNWLTGNFLEMSSSETITLAAVFEKLHAEIQLRNSKGTDGRTIKHWHEVNGAYAKAAPRHRSGRAGHNSQSALQPEATADAARFAEADAEAKMAANMPVRAASGELIGPDAANPLFDIDTYIENGPFFMPGMLSNEAEAAGVPEKIFDVFHDV